MPELDVQQYSGCMVHMPPQAELGQHLHRPTAYGSCVATGLQTSHEGLLLQAVCLGAGQELLSCPAEHCLRLPWTQLQAHWLHASRSQDTAAPMSAASQAHLATEGEGPFTGPFSVAPRSFSTAPVPKHRGPVWGPKVHQSADEALQHVEGGQSYSARTYL